MKHFDQRVDLHELTSPQIEETLLTEDVQQCHPANAILANYRVMTDYPMAHVSQIGNGPLAADMRLLPKIPFVLGGSFEGDNLYCSSDIKVMQARGSIAKQIR